MLNELQILNGEMPLEFNSLNTIYTINVSNKETTLDLAYKTDDSNNISVFGNILKPGENEVVITVYNDSEMMSYYLYVYKEEALEATSNINDTNSLEIAHSPLPNYAISSIASICFLIILLFFTLLFKKNKN